MKKSTTLSTLAVAVVAPLALAGCGSSGTTGSSHTGTSSPTIESIATKADATSHTKADATFAAMMIPHHQQAVEMATLAATRAGSPQVKELATTIEAAQGPEITTMSGWLRAWGMSGMSGHDMGSMSSGHDMSGMMSPDDMASLARLSGTAFDKRFLTMMISHHEGAISMAKRELQDGRYADALALAASIAVSQQGQISQMKAMLR